MKISLLKDRIKRKLKKLKRNPKKFFLDSPLVYTVIKILIKLKIIKKAPVLQYPPAWKQANMVAKKIVKRETKSTRTIFYSNCCNKRNYTGALYFLGGVKTARVSSIEDMLSRISLYKDRTSSDDAEALNTLKIIAASRHCPLETLDQKVVLVIGQSKVNIDTTASKVSKRNPSNLGLIRAACSENPSAIVAYLPFDDSEDTTAQLLAFSELDTDQVRILDSDCLPRQSDILKVYTVDSIIALEYLFFSVPVVVFGQPFYAGLGLTDDRCDEIKFKNKCSLTELFSATFILSCQYTNPLTGTRMNVADALKTIYMMRKDTFFWAVVCCQEDGVPPDLLSEAYSSAVINPSFDEQTEEEILLIDKPHKIVNPYGGMLNDLLSRKEISLEHLDNIISIYSIDVILRSFLFVLHFSYRYGRFDHIQKLINYCCAWFTQMQTSMTDVQKKTFMEDMVAFSRHLYGRPITPPHYRYSSNKLSSAEGDALLAYWELLSISYDYDAMEDIINTINDDNPNFLYALCRMANIITPLYGDPDPYRRNRLCRKLAANAMEKISVQHTGKINQEISQIQYHINMQNVDEALKMINDLDFDDWSPFIKGRTPAVNQIVGFLMANRHYEQALKINELMSVYAPKTAFMNTARYLSEMGDLEALEKLMEDNNHFTFTVNELTSYPLALRTYDRFDEAYNYVHGIVKPGFKRAQKYQLTRFWPDLYKMVADIDAYYSRVEQPEQPKGLIVNMVTNDPQFSAMVLPFFLEAKKQNYAVASITPGFMRHQDTGIEAFDSYYANKQPNINGYFDDRLELSWNIDLKNKIIEAEGINFYQGFYETMAIETRSYDIDYDSPQVLKLFRMRLFAADYLLRDLIYLKKAIADEGICTYIVTNWLSHSAPYSVIRDYCARMGGDNFQMIYIMPGYDLYNYPDSLFTHTVSIVNATLHPKCRIPHIGVKEKFQQWYEEFGHEENVQVNIDNIINKYETAKAVISNKCLHKYLKILKSKGKKIICCFPRLLVDMAYPEADGPAHADIIDWIRHTIESVRDRDDIVLLIKPHPAELSPLIGTSLRSYIENYLPNPLPDNVKFLKSKNLTTAELTEVIDLGLIWTGTTGYELVMLGVPVMAAATWGVNDYLFDIPSPRDKADYTAFLLEKKVIKITEDQRRIAAAAMYYRSSDEVTLPMNYVSLALTNTLVGIQPLNEKAFNKYFEQGDEMVAKGLELFFN